MERGLGKIIDDDIDRGRLVERNGRVYLEANNAYDLHCIMSYSDDMHLSSSGLDDVYAERHTTYGDLRRSLSGCTIRPQDSD